MYIYYEEFTDVTCVVLSSNGRDTFINKRNKKEDAIKNICLNLMKQVKLKSRDFNEKTYVWTFIGVGKVIITQFESMCLQGLFENSKVVKIENLEAKAASGELNRVDKKEKEKKFSDEFYYAPNGSAEGLTGSALIAKLAPLLGLSVNELSNSSDDAILKKKYRMAALRLHPDRNNGDGSKMSELNMLWNIYMNKGV